VKSSQDAGGNTDEVRMGRKDWERMDSINELASISGNRGRGWRIFSGVLLAGLATLAAAYYLPLHRAHAALIVKFRNLSQEATTQRKQLTDTISTLKQVADERDALSAQSRKKQEANASIASQLDSLERELKTQLKKYIGPHKLQLERQKEKLTFTLDSPAMVASTGGTLTEAGKSAICIIGAGAKAANLATLVRAVAVTPANKPGPDWLNPALRAGNASQQLVAKCGLEASTISMQIGPPSSKLTAALVLDIVPST
jgi:hypothetical protein